MDCGCCLVGLSPVQENNWAPESAVTYSIYHDEVSVIDREMLHSIKELTTTNGDLFE